MPEIRYAPGALRVIVAGRGVAVLGKGATDAATLAIHDRLAAGEGFGAVVDALAAGGSLAHLPAFVVVVDEGAAWRVSVRGDLSAVVTTPSGTETIDGSAASTWSERSILGVTRLSIANGTGTDASAAVLPIADGVVLASAVIVAASSASLASPSGGPAAVAEPLSPAEPIQPHSVAEVRDSVDDAEPAVPEVPIAPTGTVASVAVEAPVADESSVDPEAPVGAESPADPEDPLEAESPVEPSVPIASEAEAGAEIDVAAESPEPEPEPEAGQPASPVEAVQPHDLSEVSVPAPVPPPLPPLPAIPPPPPLPGSDDGMLIDSIPPFPRAGGPTPDVAPAPAPVGAGAASADDDLEATTVVGRPLRERLSAPEATDGLQGDHDGETLSLEEARRLRAGGTLPPPATVAAPVLIPAAPLGRLRLSTGQIVLLDRTVIIGRRPGSSRASGAEMPHLIGVDSPQQDISRNHVEVRTEGDSILATDLQTTNGTTLLRQGSAPTRLHPGEPTIVVAGDVLDLGDGVTVAIETPTVETVAVETPV